MAKITETDALKRLEEILVSVDDPDACLRILNWAFSRFCKGSVQPIEATVGKVTPTGAKPAFKRTKRSRTNKKAKTAKVALAIDKNLELRPKGKQSLEEFVAEKQPKSDREKVAVCVYYLKNNRSMKTVNANHVYTCFRDMSKIWKLPYDVRQLLIWVASQKGWLETSEMEDIKITQRGLNHLLPAKKGK
jgi:hypothetical protein